LNGSQQEILDKITDAVKNPTTIHYLDEQRVACIFYNVLKQHGKIDLDGLGQMLKDLPPDYSEYTKERINDIASVIESLAHCHEVLG
jgi:hypothetical protein